MKNHKLSVFGFDVNSLLSILPNSTYRLLVVIAIVFGFGIGYGLNYKPTTNYQSPAITQTRQYTLLQYERLTLGMSLVEVQAILDAGTETQRSTTTRVFIWKNPADGSKITATFTDGKLTHKEQMGF